MIVGSLANDSFIPCHKTLGRLEGVCRGFYDQYKRDSLGLRLGAIIGVIQIDPDVETN